MFVLVLAAFIVIALLEMVPLYKGKNKKEFILYCSLYSIAFILSMLMSFGVKLPSVANFIKVIVMFVKKGFKVE